MLYAITAEIRDPRAGQFTFTHHKTMYGGRHIAKGDMIYVFAHEKNAPGLLARGIVESAEAVPRKRGLVRQTPRVNVIVQRIALAKAALGRSELRPFTDWKDGRPETELNFRFYRQSTAKIVGITDATALFIDGFF